MRKEYIILSFLMTFLWSCSTPDVEYRKQDQLALIPQPRKMEVSEGVFVLDYNTRFWASPGLHNDDMIFAHTIEQKTGIKIFGEDREDNANVIFLIDSSITSKEGYRLTITEDKLKLVAGTPEGILRGIQTIWQLMVEDFHTGKLSEHIGLPLVNIEDEPQFQHRGMLLDVCRHFFDVDVVKKYIDVLAYYKMNVLHFHLTEDQGWRIESEKYPKLNEISSYRTELDGSKYGGYYTKAQLKEIVEYASSRYITVIPEIELPGHAQAALAAYPEFSCVGRAGDIQVANDWGVFKEIYCAGNDSTFTFLENILTEVMEIFPSEYIHIGGDEAPKFRWENCNKCQQRIKDEGLKDEHELQSYFIRRIEKFLNANGRKLIGWDEILEGGLSPNATVQCWRGVNYGMEAAEQQHDVIMSPTSHCYLDYQLDKIDLEKIYSFDPYPEELDEKHREFIIGGECNMWTEHVPDEKTLDQRINPRMQALSEVLWLYPTERDYEDFYNRLQAHYPVLTAMGVQFGAEAIPSSIEVGFDNEQVKVKMKQNVPGVELEAVYNGQSVDAKRLFTIQESGKLEVKAMKNGTAYGEALEQEFAFHQALVKEVKYNKPFNEWYTAGGEKGLVDGKLGSLNFRDGNWQGFYGNDVDVVMDLGEEKSITSVSSNFYHYNNAWVFAPKKYKVSISNDAYSWTMLGEVSAKTNPEQRGSLIEKLQVTGEGQGRYVKVEVESLGVVPDWHEAAGSKAWIFMDEIIVE